MSQPHDTPAPRPRRRTRKIDAVQQEPLVIRIAGQKYEIDFTAEIREILEEDYAPAPVITIPKNSA